MRVKIAVLLLSAMLAQPAAAVTCNDGLSAVADMSRIMDLNMAEKANVDALIVKAKLEAEQGRQRNCKLILADAIRFFLIKSVIQ